MLAENGVIFDKSYVSSPYVPQVDTVFSPEIMPVESNKSNIKNMKDKPM